MRLGIVAAFVVVAATGTAEARAWFTNTEDDIFSGGKTAVMMAGSGRNDAVYFDCGPDGEIEFSVIFRYDGGVQAGLPSEIVVKVDDGETRRFPAASYQHNDEYGGFVVPDSEDLVPLLNDIKGAASRVLIGTEVVDRDSRHSFAIPATGSTRAVETLQSACAR